ncbi:hypothetical protein Dimus_025248 [Dionaea muscipula]
MEYHEEEADQGVRVHDGIRSRVAEKFSNFSPASSKLKFGSASTASFFLLALFIITLVSTRWSSFAELSFLRRASFTQMSLNYPMKYEYALTCPKTNMTLTCPANYATPETWSSWSQRSCPDYFGWIHEDLKPWKMTGITREMVEQAKKYAHFRLVIVNGTAYVKQYDKAFQTRDVFTLWGVLQLLKLYPGRLPDVDLMFQCHDRPSINKNEYRRGEKDVVQAPPPLFHYCGSESTFDIVFPDWSFWGWPEINIKPWVPLMKDMEEGNQRINWTNREPYAFWKGNLHTGPRVKLGRCNSIKDWNAQILQQDWRKETSQGFRNSDLSKQCTHRYKIYMEGNAWSVSEKYILACDSMTLLVDPAFYDFFTRSLIPMKHYWPINSVHICSSIKFAVEWGNNHTDEAQKIGKAGSNFIKQEMTMDHIYDYMFHVLDQYGKLFKYKPTVPPGAVELCSDTWSCSPVGLETTDKIESMVNGRSEQSPCTIPPPYNERALEAFLEQNDKIKKQVEEWESQGNP